MALPNELLIQPQSLGENYLSGIEIQGPASYDSTNGQKQYATAYGMGSVRRVIAECFSASKTYYVRVFQGRGPTSTFVLRWYTTSGNAPSTEVTNTTNLSAEYVKILAIGN